MNKELIKHIQEYKVVRVAFSSGKDSSCVLHLLLESMLTLKKEGCKTLPKILVSTSDTGVESPVVSNQVMSDHKAIKEFAKKHSMDIETMIVRPALTFSFYGRTLGTGILPVYGNLGRSCTQDWKIMPQIRAQNAFMKKNQLKKEDVLVLVGSRTSESTGRKSRMVKQGVAEGEVSVNEDGYAVLAPIYNWDTDDVFMLLASIMNNEVDATYSDMTNVLRIYENANGECPIIRDNLTKNAKACGARFGCFTCVAGSVAGKNHESINGDKSLEAMIAYEKEGERPYAYLEPLSRIQRFLASIQYDFERRNVLGRALVQGETVGEGRKGQFLKLDLGCFNGETLINLVEYLVTAQTEEAEYALKSGIEPRFELISLKELIYIDCRQSMSGLTESHATLDAYHRIVNLGERHYPKDYKETFVARTPMPKRKYVELYPSGLKSLKIQTSDVYEVSDEAVEWVLSGGARILSDKFNNKSFWSSRLDAFFFWNKAGFVKVSKRGLSQAKKRISLTRAIEDRGLYEVSDQELYAQGVDLNNVARVTKGLEDIPVESRM